MILAIYDQFEFLGGKHIGISHNIELSVFEFSSRTEVNEDNARLSLSRRRNGYIIQI